MESKPLFTDRSVCTTASGDIEEAPLSELAALCSDDIPSNETRRDPDTDKVWTYSAYRSAHIAVLDLLSIRNHWLSNCTLVAASEARTQEFVRSWLPPPWPSNSEPEAEVEGIQE